MQHEHEDAWYLEPVAPIPRARKAYVGLGSNVGDSSGSIIRAASELGAIAGVRVIATSRLYTTRPVGIEDQPDFINAAAELEIDCSPRSLLDGMLALERRYGRDRSKERRWGPRTLDLDLLLFGDRVIDEPGLTVPHPRMAERRFVLQPLADLAPALVPPGWKVSIAGALAAFDAEVSGAGAGV
ncbi:MAG: 2-amino-4-hydroxy-6-hydroxymethyldihydropteridine diphosphokinase [Phycisphaerales bacterium]